MLLASIHDRSQYNLYGEKDIDAELDRQMPATMDKLNKNCKIPELSSSQKLEHC